MRCKQLPEHTHRHTDTQTHTDTHTHTHTHTIMFNPSVTGAMLLFLKVKMTQNMKC